MGDVPSKSPRGAGRDGLLHGADRDVSHSVEQGRNEAGSHGRAPGPPRGASWPRSRRLDRHRVVGPCLDAPFLVPMPTLCSSGERRFDSERYEPSPTESPCTIPPTFDSTKPSHSSLAPAPVSAAPSLRPSPAAGAAVVVTDRDATAAVATCGSHHRGRRAS